MVILWTDRRRLVYSVRSPMKFCREKHNNLCNTFALSISIAQVIRWTIGGFGMKPLCNHGHSCRSFDSACCSCDGVRSALGVRCCVQPLFADGTQAGERPLDRW